MTNKNAKTKNNWKQMSADLEGFFCFKQIFEFSFVILLFNILFLHSSSFPNRIFYTTALNNNNVYQEANELGLTYLFVFSIIESCT
jgi:hypothetical protein